MMTTTFHPATNRYAAIVEAVRTPPPPRPRLHLARISLSVPPLTTEEGGTSAPSPSRPTPDERAIKRAAILADYADALPAVRTRAEHGMLTTRLARKHDVPYPYVKSVTADWREAHDYRVPTYSADGDALRPGEVELLQVLAARPDVLSCDHLAAELGRENARAIVALTGDPDARAVIVTTHGCGYDLDRDAARRYPVIAAALEGCAS